MRIPIFAKTPLLLIAASFATSHTFAQSDNQDFVPSEACIKILRSRCDATQQELLDELLLKLKIYGIGDKFKRYPGKPLAFQVLPKDELGLINWIRAEADGVIKPRGALIGEEEEPYEGFSENLFLFQSDAHFLADVVFPHGMHTHWLSCDSCHPEPFKAQRGGNNMKMSEILNGKGCGKCHGTVAFPTEAYSNCRRCHVFPKRPVGK